MAISIAEDQSRSSPNHRRFIVHFHGTPVSTIVTSTSRIVRKWLRTTLYHRRQLRHRLVVGLGVQWRPSFRAGDEPPAATLQLCVGRHCLIFQLIHSDTVPKFLRRFLLNPNHTFVGMWNHSDSKSLMNSKHELYMHREPLDLRQYALSKDGRSLTLQSRDNIVKECLGQDVRFERWISKSNWDNKELSDKQILQACVEAYASFQIGKDLKAWEL